MARKKQPRIAQKVEWHFFSFPVAFGFALGALIATFLVPFLNLVLVIPALFGVSWGTAHIISHWFQNRAITRRQDRDEDAERERRALAARAAKSSETPEQPATPARRKRRRR